MQLINFLDVVYLMIQILLYNGMNHDLRQINIWHESIFDTNFFNDS